MPPLTLPEEGLTKGVTTPPSVLWNATQKAAPARNLERHDLSHPVHVCRVGECPRTCHVHVASSHTLVIWGSESPCTWIINFHVAKLLIKPTPNLLVLQPTFLHQLGRFP